MRVDWCLIPDCNTILCLAMSVLYLITDLMDAPQNEQEHEPIIKTHIQLAPEPVAPEPEGRRSSVHAALRQILEGKKAWEARKLGRQRFAWSRLLRHRIRHCKMFGIHAIFRHHFIPLVTRKFAAASTIPHQRAQRPARTRSS